MTKFRLRYTKGNGPTPDDSVEVEAAMFVTKDPFVDFYSQGERNLGGTLNPRGDIVLRVRSDLVADVQIVE